MEKSRFKNHLKRKAYQNILLAVLGIVLVLVLLIIFGTNLLVGFSLLVGKLTGNDEPINTSQSSTYISPPLLDATFEATNSASITISGSGTPKQKINLYVNGRLLDATSVKSNNIFSFTNVSLEDGTNTIKAKAILDKKQSDYSNEIKVLKINKEPTLEISSPAEGQKFKKEESPIKIIGQTDPNVKVTVNDFWAISDGSGKYTYSYTLRDGDNTIKVVATDLAGNKTTKDIHFRVE